ncbi:unnamed protein product [Ambrosiozyma monospora]|uniref:Unnamed protein product n=1 Tax=Ambrosiozyma monospora TaxID=43982 RepID=A0ACB5TE36_AMBMO|nr:unnamed protein product [Ambrosiozyma monospora]
MVDDIKSMEEFTILALAPKLEQISEECTSVDFYKVEVDELAEVAASNGISSMPTFLFFRDGELVGKVIGANPYAIKKEVTKLVQD